MIVRRVVADDIDTLLESAAEVELRAYRDKPHDLTVMVGSPWGWSLWRDSLAAAGGILAFSDHVGLAWGIVGRINRRDVLPVCRIVKRKLQASPFGWIEAQVNTHSRAARAFAQACGFEALDAPDHEAEGLSFARMVYRKGLLK